MKPNIARMQKKGAILSVYHVRKLRSKFDGKTQAVRGALIAELEELHRWTLERVKAVRDKKLKKYRGITFVLKISRKSFASNDDCSACGEA